MNSPLDGLQEEQEQLYTHDDFDDLDFDALGGRPSPFSAKKVLFSAPTNVSTDDWYLVTGTSVLYARNSFFHHPAFLISQPLGGVSDARRL